MLILLRGSAAASTCIASTWLVALILANLVLHWRDHAVHVQAPGADLVPGVEGQRLRRYIHLLLILYNAELGFHWMLSHRCHCC